MDGALVLLLRSNAVSTAWVMAAAMSLSPSAMLTDGQGRLTVCYVLLSMVVRGDVQIALVATHHRGAFDLPNHDYDSRDVIFESEAVNKTE